MFSGIQLFGAVCHGEQADRYDIPLRSLTLHIILCPIAFTAFLMSLFLFFDFLGFIFFFFFVVKETVTVSMSYILRGSWADGILFRSSMNTGGKRRKGEGQGWSDTIQLV